MWVLTEFGVWSGLLWTRHSYKLRGRVPVRGGDQASPGQVARGTQSRLLKVDSPTSEQAKNQELQRNESRRKSWKDVKELTAASSLDASVCPSSTSYGGWLARTATAKEKCFILGPHNL